MFVCPDKKTICKTINYNTGDYKCQNCYNINKKDPTFFNCGRTDKNTCSCSHKRTSEVDCYQKYGKSNIFYNCYVHQVSRSSKRTCKCDRRTDEEMADYCYATEKSSKGNLYQREKVKCVWKYGAYFSNPSKLNFLEGKCHCEDINECHPSHEGYKECQLQNKKCVNEKFTGYHCRSSNEEPTCENSGTHSSCESNELCHNYGHKNRCRSCNYYDNYGKRRSVNFWESKVKCVRVKDRFGLSFCQCVDIDECLSEDTHHCGRGHQEGTFCENIDWMVFQKGAGYKCRRY